MNYSLFQHFLVFLRYFKPELWCVRLKHNRFDNQALIFLRSGCYFTFVRLPLDAATTNQPGSKLYQHHTHDLPRVEMI